MDPSRRSLLLTSTSLVAAAIAVIAMVTTQAPAAARQANAPPQGPALVALTFDDLPSHGPLPSGLSRVDIARSIIETLRSHQAPAVYGFINAKALDTKPEDAEVLRLWRAAGFPLGNHAYSHLDLHGHDVAAFQQDVIANEAALQSLMTGQDWRWFRYPYLHEGETREKHREVQDFLKTRGYRIAEVTLSFDDYAYNEPYARCLAKNDTEGIAWLRESFITRASESLTRGQNSSREIFGRDIKHIMLLHIGGFQTVMLPALLETLKQRGFALTTLEDAASDPAYAIDPARRSRWSGTFFNQLATATPAPPPAAPRPQAESIFARLSAICS